MLDDFDAARAALAWQVELGATEAIGDAPVDRYALPDRAPAAGKPAAPSRPAAAPAETAPPAPADTDDPVAAAQRAADAAPTRDALRTALDAYPHCELRRGARNLVFCDGNPAARVMIVGEAPGREEDRQGKPFVGEAGQLLDRMFAAIDMARDHTDAARALYITNILPWRPPQNRDPSAEERAMMLPFVTRHVALAAPDILIAMGRISAATLLDLSARITRIRGQWHRALDLPVVPMLHPAYLLRNPAAKREAWADLLTLQAELRTLP